MWVIVCLFSTTTFLIQGGVPKCNKGTTICIPHRLRIADKCLIADLEAFIVIYLTDYCDLLLITSSPVVTGAFGESTGGRLGFISLRSAGRDVRLFASSVRLCRL